METALEVEKHKGSNRTMEEQKRFELFLEANERVFLLNCFEREL